MMYLVVKNSGQSGELRLQGALDSRMIEELKWNLHQALKDVTDLTIDCSDVTAVDASCLQLLCSAYRMSRQQFRKFTPKGHRPNLFMEAAKAANYVHCVGCGLEDECGCVWGVC